MSSDWARLGKDGTLLYRPLVIRNLESRTISVVTITGDLQQAPLKKEQDSREASAELTHFQSTEERTVYLNRSTLMLTGTSYTEADQSWHERCLVGNSPDETFKLVSYYLSDVIIVQQNSVKEAASEYMQWVHVCGRLKRSSRQSPPFVVVYIPDANDPTDDWKLELSSIYMELNDVELEKFSNLPNPYIVNEGSELEPLMMELVCQAYQIRESNRHIWSRDEFAQLHEQLVYSFCDRSRCSFAEVEALGALNSLRKYSGDWHDEMEYPEEILVHVLSKNLARYAASLQHGK